jgi:beta-1,4-galactosyltransferase 4
MKAGIIIPFRDTENGERSIELKILVDRINYICKKNKQDYHIYVIIQDDYKLYNKATLMNVAVDICKNDVDYFIFHDVDNIPENDSNVYKYRDFTGNICKEINGVKYTDKDDHFGDVVFFKKEDFFAINGFSNMYFGWGMEVSHTPHRLNEKGIIYKRGDGIFYTLVHDTSHRFNGNPNFVNNMLIYNFIEMEILDGYMELKYLIDKVEIKDSHRTDYYIIFPPPQYILSTTMTINQIKELGGKVNEEEYNRVINQYSI